MKKVKGWDFLVLALIAFGGLGMEVLYAFFLEPMIYGTQMQEWSAGQTILHWIITCLTWGLFAWYLIRTAKKKYEFDLSIPGEKIKTWQIVICVFAIVFAFVISYMDWEGFKILIEFQRKGWLLFIFQYIYYAFETVLFSLIIIFGQKAFETWTHREKIPFGGIVCGLTWGLAHILTKGSVMVGLELMLLGFLMGSVYLLVNRDCKKAMLVLFFMFII